MSDRSIVIQKIADPEPSIPVDPAFDDVDTRIREVLGWAEDVEVDFDLFHVVQADGYEGLLTLPCGIQEAVDLDEVLTEMEDEHHIPPDVFAEYVSDSSRDAEAAGHNIRRNGVFYGEHRDLAEFGEQTYRDIYGDPPGDLERYIDWGKYGSDLESDFHVITRRDGIYVFRNE